MKKITTLTLGALSLVALASGCNVEVGEAVEEGSIDTTEQAVSCGNEEGVASVMAAMAVAAAQEMRRWLPDRDMYWNNSTWQLALTSYAPPRCPNRVCKNMNGLLALQNDAANGMIIGGQPLWAPTLRDRMNTYWNRQAQCKANGGGNCLAPVFKTGQPAEYHDFTPVWPYKTPSACGSDFFFHACIQGTGGPGQPACQELTKPGSLKNNLIWAGAPENQYLAFYNNGGYVKIDPTGDLIEGDGSTTTSGSQTCAAACTKFSGVSLTGQCCVCNGATKTFKPRTGMANWYVCQ